MYCRENALFQGGKLDSLLETQKSKILAEIDGTDRDYILNVDSDRFTAHLLDKHAPEVPAIDHNAISLTQGEIQERWEQFGRSGVAQKGVVTFHVPFSGEPDLLTRSPSRWSSAPPHGDVRNDWQTQELLMSFVVDGGNSNALNKSFEDNLKALEEHLLWVQNDVSIWIRSMTITARERIEQRRKRLLAERGILADLKYPLKHREDVPAQTVVPVKRKRIPIERPPSSCQPFTPEPALSASDYEDLLRSLANMALVLERAPSAFTKMNEEDLRCHFLIGLNALYEGQAVGEAFNGQGKTDILIRVGGGNVFIAECKFWKGPKGFQETIDQLSGYVTWRDTKTAILLFNRSKNLSDVLQKIPSVVETHPLFKRSLKSASNTMTEFQYTLRHPSDSNREFQMAVLVFEVPG